MTIQCGFRNDHREGERSAPTKGPVNRSLERSREKSKQTVNPETDKENFVPRCGAIIVRQEPSPTVFFFFVVLTAKGPLRNALCLMLLHLHW